ncbi:hypothetical protein pb186bvf_014099 [Paramecium bursaria]
MSFFQQEQAIATIEIPHEKASKWRNLYKEQKLAAKIEFRNNQYYLIINDGNNFELSLDGLSQPGNSNLIAKISPQVEFVGMSQYQCHFGKDDEIPKLKEMKISKQQQIEESEESEDFGVQNILTKPHIKLTQNQKQPDYRETAEYVDPDSYEKIIFDYGQYNDYKEFSMKEFKEYAMKSLKGATKFEDKALKSILSKLCHKSKKNNVAMYTMRQMYK